jgi:GTPase
MIELEPPQERALLVGAPPKWLPQATADEHLEELARLTDTAGALVLGTVRQRLESPHPKYYLGEGKAEELREQARAARASLIVFDEELSPAQGKNLEELTGIRLMDRAELILDIFATRARTAEAKLQVELAQLQYLLPRLTRMWVHLSRVRGGIGMRGPGETQLETDRRMISQRIDRLKDELERVARQRATQRRGREDVFQAALVGYTNAGKSSILKRISGSDIFVEDRLFATLDATTRAVELDDGFAALVTDTVGFIRKLPHHLVASFRATLEETTEADLLLHVIDASHSSWEEQKEVVDEVLASLGVHEQPTLLVFNKIDRLTHAEENAARERAAALYPQPAVFVSTLTKDGLEPLRDALRERVRARLSEVRIDLPASQGAMLAEIYREGEVVERQDDGAVIHLRARLPEPALGRLRQRGVTVQGRA